MRDVRRRAVFGTCTLILCLALFNVVSGFSRAVRIEPLDGQTRNPPRPPQSVRLYVLDGGTLESDPARYQLKRDEVSATPLSVTAFLIVHPKGTLMWDTAANANQFVKSTWLARQVERDAMLPDKAADPPQPSTFADLKNGRTVLVVTDDHDVFGDGTVVMKLAKGHTPGHQVLYVKLAKTGGVVLSGDLYHYPEERTLNRLPTFEFSVEQTREARTALDAFLKQTGAQLWIQHDLAAMAKVRKAPAFYE